MPGTIDSIIFTPPEAGKAPPPPETPHRAVHQIRLSSLSHNYACVESAAAKQRCSVIVVVKADGYGHGAIESAIYLADHAGADAFAVATLEEGIALRKAFLETAPGSTIGQQQLKNTKANASHAGDTATTLSSDSSIQQQPQPRIRQQQIHRCIRAPQIRILVLGPPVGYPRCFDEYFHYGIEVMCSGPEVARGMMEWVSDEKERKRTQVERAANDAKQEALLSRPPPQVVPSRPPVTKNRDTTPTKSSSNTNSKDGDERERIRQLGDAAEYKEPTYSATLGNVSGQDLAKEVRQLLMNQQAAKAKQQQQQQNGTTHHSSDVSSTSSGQQQQQQQPQQRDAANPQEMAPAETQTSAASTGSTQQQPQPATTGVVVVNNSNKGQTLFGGIEAVAKNSRTREAAVAKAHGIFREDSTASDDTVPTGSSHVASSTISPLTTTTNTSTTSTSTQVLRAGGGGNQQARKRLRYHILVDSGMGRLGFKTQPVEVSDVGVRRDTVEIINELVEMEVSGAPVEFFGMCTHMADASSTSTYTNDQMNRFKGLLKRTRGAGISIPTVSTDNSAALLTTTLKHFDAKALLSQPHAETRGFVRTGGAIYGQRPAFTQLHAVSTLLASVRHVAVLKEGESVGYDRAYIAPQSVRIATLTIGFADGYPRDLGNGIGKVAIKGHLFPVAGNVCMDMMMVELGPAGDKQGPGAQVVVGDTAVLWGPLDESDGDGLVRLQDIAKTLKTTQSALTCGLDKTRVLRQYVE